MKILICHNFYRDPGGEDQVVPATIELLRARGHHVIELLADNSEIGDGVLAQAAVGACLLVSPAMIRRTVELVEAEQPDVAHVHNVFSQLTPSLYTGLARAGVPVVQSVHNYRFVCPNGLFYTHGEVCMRCTGGNFAHAVRLRCLHGSLSQSVAYAASLQLHWAIGTFPHRLGILAAVSPFVAQQLARRVSGQIPIRVLPNFIDTAPFQPREGPPGDYALYMGRLSPEKGVWRLLEAAERAPGLPIRVMGGGPDEAALREHIAAHRLGNVELLGHVEGDTRFDVVRNARCLVVPSQWHEPFGVVVLEAYAHGVPVIASRMGGLQTLVVEGESGLLFEAANAGELASHLRWMAENPEQAAALGSAGRRLVGELYSPDVHYEQLIALYEEACERGAGR